MMSRKPIVLVSACTRYMGEHPFHGAGKKYLDAVVVGAGCHPLILPLVGSEEDLTGILSVVDGILLTGSPSNVHPSHYGQTIRDPELLLDPARDAVTLQIVRKVSRMGMPLFAICRGFQEVNVA